MEKIDDGLLDVEQLLQVERPRLLRLCSRITGNASVAEDMVQETLLEAWRHLDNLQDTEKFAPWLSGIARNVCLRWQQRQQRERSHLIEVPARDGDGLTTLAETLLDDCDVEIELERRELASLLDQAMDLLPRQTRTMLLERYVRDAPLADIASLLGMNVNAVSMRLQRGKLALRRALAAELKLEAEDYAPQKHENWTQTSLWCYLCGQQRLLGKFQPEQLELYLKCPTCCPEPNDYISSNNGLDILRGVKSYKPALTRLSNWAYHYYGTALHEGAVACCECGHMVPLRFQMPADASSWLRQRNVPIIYLYCEHCHSRCYNALDHQSMLLPEMQNFRRKHPRIHALPPVYEEVNGGHAMITRYESMTSTEHVEVVTSLENYRVLTIVGAQA